MNRSFINTAWRYVFSLGGKPVVNVVPGTKSYDVDVSGLSAGIYIARVLTEGGNLMYKKAHYSQICTTHRLFPFQRV